VTRAARVVVAVVSDLHVGSTFGLCPPSGIELEDGGRYMPNIVQGWQWGRWLDYWQDVSDYAQGAEVIGVVNGEFCDGNHHGTTQIATPSPAMMAEAAVEVMQPACKMASQWYVTKGTAAHVGAGGASDAGIAARIGAVRDPETNQAAAYNWRVQIGPVLFDLAHHIGGNLRPWTRGTNIRAEVIEALIHTAHRPLVVVRSHVHTYVDTGRTFGDARGVVTPAWQLITEYGHRVTRNPQRTVGGLVFEVSETGYRFEPLLYHLPERAIHQAQTTARFSMRSQPSAPRSHGNRANGRSRKSSSARG